MKQHNWKQQWNQWKYVLVVLVLGVGLLLWPGVKESAPSVDAPTQDIQGEMEEILSTISGVGTLKLMLTLETDGETELASDDSLSYSGNVNAPEDYTRQRDVVTASDGAIVTQRRYPTYRGALVVCQGGDNPDVQLAVTQSVAALTGLGSDRITVVKWQ